MADSEDGWGVEDVEADDGRKVEALEALRNGHCDVEDDAEAGLGLDNSGNCCRREEARSCWMMTHPEK